MKNINDYPSTLVKLFNTVEMDVNRSEDYLIIRSVNLKVKETAKILEVTDGSRIKKVDLCTPKSLDRFYPYFEVYCLPHQIEEAKENLVAAVTKHTLKQLKGFERIKSQIENKTVTLSESEYFDHVSQATRRRLDDQSVEP